MRLTPSSSPDKTQSVRIRWSYAGFLAFLRKPIRIRWSYAGLLAFVLFLVVGGIALVKSLPSPIDRHIPCLSVASCEESLNGQLDAGKIQLPNSPLFKFVTGSFVLLPGWPAPWEALITYRYKGPGANMMSSFVNGQDTIQIRILPWPSLPFHYYCEAPYWKTIRYNGKSICVEWQNRLGWFGPTANLESNGIYYTLSTGIKKHDWPGAEGDVRRMIVNAFGSFRSPCTFSPSNLLAQATQGQWRGPIRRTRVPSTCFWTPWN